MKIIRKFNCLFLVIVLQGCSEPFSFETRDSNIDVIDAKVSTRMGRSYIRIYHIKDNDKQAFIDGLDVRIISSDGEVYDFDYVASRHSYLPKEPDFVGQVGLKYKMEVQNSEGAVYQSQYDSIPEPIELNMLFKDTIAIEVSPYNVIIEKRAIAAIAEVQSIATSTSFAKIDFIYTYETTIGSVRNASPEKYILYESESNGLKVRIPIGLMFSQDFSQAKTEIFLESLSPSSFKYWKSAQRLISNDGIISDTYPFPLKGNVTCTNCENEVVGFFRSVSESYRGQIWFE